MDIEDIGKAADTVDYLLSALSLPLPPQMHVDAMRASLPGLRDELRRIYVAEAGENPWAELGQ